MRYTDSGEYRSPGFVATESVTSVAPAIEAPQDALPASGNSDKHKETSTVEAERIRVFLVDDHTLVREGLAQLFTLEEDIEVIGVASDGFAALEQIRAIQPDVVLMDIYLPVVDGIAITRQLTEQFPEMAVIMLTMHRHQQQIVEAMKSGAKGYLLKSSTAQEVALAIRMVRAGEIAITPTLTGALVSELRRQPEPSVNGHNMAQLSDKEVEIIRYLAAGMSNKEIAEHLAYSEKTVKNYLSIIFQKLHLRDRTQVAIFALRQGFLPEECI